ncbi:hypothetical protein DICVIV_12552 [Dictyocaulus viviparus]|uniref:Uncharacterized protein n=1 Tax=Dictyocaulus viviparus TaxID=29172 RepID=A0A0D8XA78_DICVI|nr:hypothetical protein DICVIV_12552 [Dictyocaulus viviparus]
MCSISVETVGGKALFSQRKCSSQGCHNMNTNSPYCCCHTDECNTISFYELNSRTTYSIQYIGHSLILIIVIARLVII